MLLRKGQIEYKINAPFDEVRGMVIDMRRTCGPLIQLQYVRMDEVTRMAEDPVMRGLSGQSRFFSIDRNNRSVFVLPPPDKSYPAELHLTRFFKV